MTKIKNRVSKLKTRPQASVKYLILLIDWTSDTTFTNASSITTITWIFVPNLQKMFPKSSLLAYIYIRKLDFLMFFWPQMFILSIYIYIRKRKILLQIYKKMLPKSSFWVYIYTRKIDFCTFFLTPNVHFEYIYTKT